MSDEYDTDLDDEGGSSFSLSLSHTHTTDRYATFLTKFAFNEQADIEADLIF